MLRLVRKHKLDGIYLDSAYNTPLQSSSPASSQYRMAAALTNRLTNRIRSAMQPHEILVTEISKSYLQFVDLNAMSTANASVISLTALESSRPLD